MRSLKVLFIDATKGFYPGRIKEKPTGGILTSLTLVPKYLAKCGVDVSILSEHEVDEVVDGVKFIKRPISENIWDVVVFNRNMFDRATVNFFKNSRKVWWLHDIVDHSYVQDESFRSMDVIVALSSYCRDSFSDFYGIDKNKFAIIPNGVDKEIFYPQEGGRDKNLYLCASAPIKGYYPLDLTIRNLKRYSEDFEIRLFSGSKLHGIDLTDGMLRQLNQMREAGVTISEPVPQAQLADLMRKAWAFLMPGHYPEICSNLVLQAQACGLPVIGAPIGSLPEFVTHGENGLLTKTLPHDMFWWYKDFTEQCTRLYLDEKLHNFLSRNGPGGVMSWDEIGKMWHEMLIGAKWDRPTSTINTHRNLISAGRKY